MVIYLDNAATSWPKPKQMLEAMINFTNNVGSNPGRSGHRLSVEAGRIVCDARDNIAKLFNIEDPMHVVFGLNATDGLNLAIRGTLQKGDHVITSSMEHNSVMRPLRDLEKEGVEITVVQCSKEGFLAPEDVIPAIKKNTKLIVMNHGSNVVGSLLPLREVGKIAREHHIRFAIDAAQTAGVIPIDFKNDNVDLVAFTGHNGLLGPQGTGGLAITDLMTEKDLRHIRSGGTGSKSEFEVQPEFFPDKYESGTLNTVGLAGLVAGVQFILDEGIDKIHAREMRHTKRFIKGLQDIPDVILYGGKDETRQTATMSINIKDMSQSDIGLILDEEYDIMVRVGLHCAPLAHRTIGTLPRGTVRLAAGYFTTDKEVEVALGAIKEIADNKGSAKAKAKAIPRNESICKPGAGKMAKK